jgi:hypothetical protein
MGVWEDDANATTDDGTDLVFQLFEKDGTPMGTPQTLFAIPGPQRFPVLAAQPEDGDFLVAFVDHSANPGDYYLAATSFGSFGQLRVARISPAGAVLAGPTHVGTVTRDRFPSVAVDPVHHRWLIAWDYDTNMVATDAQIGLAIVDASGPTAPLTQTGTLVYTDQPVCGAQAAWTGTRYLLAMERDCFSYTDSSLVVPPSDIAALWVDANGVPDLSPAHEVLFARDSGTGTRFAPTVAATADGRVAVAWRQQPPTSSTPTKNGSIYGALVDATGAMAPTELVRGAPTVAGPYWPRLAAEGTGFFLAFVDEDALPLQVRGTRLVVNGTALGLNAKDGIGASMQDALPVLSAAPVRPALVDPEPLGAPLARGGDGQILVAYTADQPGGVGLVHTRVVAGGSEGDACDPANKGLGCGDGRCERDPEKAGAGLCCATACSGPCQKCTLDGCVGTPSSDTACGVAKCGALSTACRAFDDAPAACLGFHRCAPADDLSSCTASHAINEGGACNAPGCKSMSTCQAGECVCGDPTADRGARRALPGCSTVGRPDRAGAIVFVLLLGAIALFVRRRRSRAGALLVAVVLIGALPACSDTGILGIDLHIDDGPLVQASRVRVVVKDASGTGFSAAAPYADTTLDETVRNIDIDGDGAREIVIDLGPKFALKRKTTYLKLTAPEKAPTRQITLSAVAIDGFGNPVAASETTSTSFAGGVASLTIKDCPVQGCLGERQVTLASPIAVDPAAHAVRALAVSAQAGLAAAGVPADDPSPAAGPGQGSTPPVPGLVTMIGPKDGALAAGAQVTGATPGDFFGRSVALGDVTGDGQVDLVVGAPGHGAGGAIYVLPSVTLTSAPTLATAGVIEIDGPSGAELGTAVDVADLDGDGVLDLVAGAPEDNLSDGGGAVYAYTVKGGAAQPLGSIAGSMGAHLGRTLDVRGGTVAAGAPGLASVELWAAGQLAAGASPQVFSSTAGGGLGAAVALVDLKSDGGLALLAGAPAGGGAILTVPLSAARVMSDADVQHAVRVVPPLGNLGGVLSRVATRNGDLVWASLPPQTASDLSLGFLLSAGSIDVGGTQLSLGTDGTLAAITATVPAARLTVAAGLTVPALPLEILIGDDHGNVYTYAFGGAQ